MSNCHKTTSSNVIPAKAGIHKKDVDARLRGHDSSSIFKRISYFSIFILLLSILYCPRISRADENNPATGLAGVAVKFYERMEYSKAKEYFRQADSLKPGGEYKRFISYGLTVLTKYDSKLKEIEALNRRLRGITALPGSAAKIGGSRLLAGKKDLIEKLEILHLNLGRRLLEEGGYVSIIKSHFEYIIAHDPVNLEAYSYLGDISYSGMLYEEAIKNYKKALSIYPDNIFFLQRLGDIYAGIGYYDEAKRCYEKSIKLLTKSRLNDKKERVAYLKRLLGKLPTAIEDIRKLIDNKSYEDVIALCKKRVAMNPSDVTAITYMGIAFEELGQWQQAEALYKAAIKRNPDYPTPHFYLGKIYLIHHKDSDKAISEIEIFKEGIEELLPIDKQAKDGLIAAQHFLIYTYHEILRDYNAAVKESKYLLELAPNDQDAHYNLALSYTYLDKKSMAYSEFKKAIDINPNAPIAASAKEAIEQLQQYQSIRSLPYRKVSE